MDYLIVNRCLKDKNMDHIDHALGRPLDPTAETYRNYFSTDDSSLASEMALSPLWTDGGCRQGPRIMRYFHVTDAGRLALADYLKAIGDQHRCYVVSFRGFETRVVATSHSKARYSYYLDLTECVPDLTFKDFCSRARVRLKDASRKTVVNEEAIPF